MEEDRVEWFRKAINELLQTSIETPTSLDQFFLAKAVQFINMLEDSQVTYNLSYVLNYAKPLGMSDRNMRRMCQQIFHTSPAEVINTHLMQQIATHLVLYPHEQISGVAFGLGFEHESTFNRFMKRRLNLHPSGFRKEFSNAVF
ncbi:MAG: AraC family transcriptional regulator [Chitinophagaceae bacterium]|nr:MAG: AraC family transcriptional regulator [Chitinophagaceae bacterium]